MPRTTATAVMDIIEVDDDLIITEADLDPFIEAANTLVTGLCVDSRYTDVLLERIERWLSAHFYCIEDPRKTIEQVDSIQDYNESKVDLYLANTRYGQAAITMDWLGSLSRYNNQLSFSATHGVIKRTQSIQTLGRKCP